LRTSTVTTRPSSSQWTSSTPIDRETSLALVQAAAVPSAAWAAADNAARSAALSALCERASRPVAITATVTMASSTAIQPRANTVATPR
jgi:hypothetical protein